MSQKKVSIPPSTGDKIQKRGLVRVKECHLQGWLFSLLFAPLASHPGSPFFFSFRSITKLTVVLYKRLSEAVQSKHTDFTSSQGCFKEPLSFPNVHKWSQKQFPGNHIVPNKIFPKSSLDRNQVLDSDLKSSKLFKGFKQIHG